MPSIIPKSRKYHLLRIAILTIILILYVMELVSRKKGRYYEVEEYLKENGSTFYRIHTDKDRFPKDGDIWVNKHYGPNDEFGGKPYKLIQDDMFICTLGKSPSVGYSLLDLNGDSCGGGAGSIDFLYMYYEYLGNIHEGYKLELAEDIFDKLDE